VAALAAKLNMDDEPLLESALDDRSKEVRRAAAELLTGLPESRRAQRMLARALPLLAWIPAEKPRMLGLRQGQPARLEIALPDACDQPMIRDGIEPKPPADRQDLGQKAWWLFQILRTVPPAIWSRRFNIAPAELIEAAARGEWHALLHEASIESMNIDLIAGLPGQTRASWSESLDWVEKLGVPHVSVYMLEVDEDSRLGREILGSGVRYGAADVPADDDIADFYELAAERLARMGIERYEISNFARPGFESRHNLKYWRLEPYLGFGADAHSFDGAMRWQNPESAAEYAAGFPAPERVPADPKAEAFFLGLRLREGVQSGEFPEVIDRFEREGLLERADGRVRLTSRGVLLSNDVFAEFVG
jgi:hypothetical protein